jgi:hypothetical protein
MLKLTTLAALPLVLAACQMPQSQDLPRIDHLMLVAQPELGGKPGSGGYVVTNYTHRVPVSPRSWRELNNAQTRKKGSGS